MVWTRQISSTMGANRDDIKIALKEILTDPDVLEIFKSTFKSVVQEETNDLRNEIGSLRDLIKDKNRKIENLETKVRTLESTVDDLEQYSRRNSIRISGIPEVQHEDVQSRVLDLFNHKMGVDTSIDDVDRMHRVGKRGDRPRAVLVKFATYRAREAVYRAKKFLKPGAERPTRNAPAWTMASAAGLDDYDAAHPEDSVIPDPSEPFNNVFIAEDLTEIRKSLLFECRRARRAQKVSDCWSLDGRVNIRDNAGNIKHIKVVADLAQYGYVPENSQNRPNPAQNTSG